MKRVILSLGLIFVAVSASAQGYRDVQANDPNGWQVALVCIIVVLSALALLWGLVFLFGKVMVAGAKERAQSSKKQIRSKSAQVAVVSGYDADVATGEVIAAIATAIRMYRKDLHDHESEIITINQVARAYSPWSSKIHGLRQMPEYKK